VPERQDLIATEGNGIPGNVSDERFAFISQPLQLSDVFEHSAELLAILFDFVLSELQAGKTRNVENFFAAAHRGDNLPRLWPVTQLLSGGGLRLPGGAHR